MIDAKQCFIDSINSPVRQIRARVELYEGSTLLKLFCYRDNLKSFTIERVGESKFFGYGVCKKLNVKLIDRERLLNITTANRLEVSFGAGCEYMYSFPYFNVTEVHRDENTNELSVTAYDALYNAAKYTVNDLGLITPYTLFDFATACASLLGLPLYIDDSMVGSFELSYPDGANFEGTETIREALNAVAEATQSIYYINNDWQLTFKRLDINGEAITTIDKDKYFTLDSGDNRRLVGISSITDLGDNVGAELAISGTTQYIRNNPFWDLREDIGELVDSALANIGGLSINQFNCDWRGNYLLEIGDKINLITKDGAIVSSYLLNDVITYDGTLSAQTEWNYDNDSIESESNPSSIGDILKQTYARVDKANRRIDILASENAVNAELIASIQIDTESITNEVQKIEEAANNSISELNEAIATLNSTVQTKLSSEELSVLVRQELTNGVDKVVTSTGFIFDETGLNVSKSGSEMNTTITEDGMTVFRDNEEVLKANNTGVEATNLYATTYLIIGSNSRLEDYGADRTGCFWIGG